MLVLADGGTLRNQIEIGMFDSDPTAACGNFVSGFPPTGTAAGEVAIFATRKETISPGTYNIVDYSLFEATTVDPDASLAAIEVGIPTVPPGPHLANSGGGLSGTLTFTSVGPEWVGSFSATIVYDGKESPLSGTFATSTSCVVVP